MRLGHESLVSCVEMMMLIRNSCVEVLLLMVQKSCTSLIGSLSHYLQGFIHPRWCRISSINSMLTLAVLLHSSKGYESHEAQIYELKC